MPDAAAAPPVFSMRAVPKVYRPGEVEVVALREVSLDIARGEFVVLLGASGSGKSTLLNILGRLDVPASGEVRLRDTHGDHRLTGAGEAALTRYRREHVGFVFPFCKLLPSLTVLENVALFTDIAPQAMDAAEAVERVGLTPRRDHFPAQLSGGEEQRVPGNVLPAVGIAAAVAPVVMGNFFRDAIEPIVDAPFSQAMRQDVTVWTFEPVDASAASAWRCAAWSATARAARRPG
jgi:predicted ABC-type transport system involved in lysophospholipase L1 biosynthesis ATPase subunit